jgi:Holliday junction resolvasome RuvABC endonuclease subunit
MGTEVRYGVGLDPGWKNAGLAIVKQDENGISLVHSETLNPSSYGSNWNFVKHVQTIVGHHVPGYRDQYAIHSIGIERFVSYNNVLTAESENILMLIGALEYEISDWRTETPPMLYRAIDWKQDLVKLLVKHRGFDNPSTSLDKKFSIAAAHACLDVKGEFSNDHEADAVCLSAIGFLKERYSKPKKALSNDTTTT